MRAAIETKHRRLGNYLLGQRIGAGGMAAVFAARQETLGSMGRLVALKVMSTALVGDAEFERLFVREAGIATRLEHRNIVRVYEVGEADGTLFIVMEYVHGVSLAELRSAQTPPPHHSLSVLSDLALALHSAHELCGEDGQPLHLVHQDISPHNVMVDYQGVVKLLDFGVARIGATDASRTETIRGKPAYLAPEQLAGERIDRRTDVFALGIIMFELLSGTRLFQRSTALATYRAVAEEPIARLDEHGDIPQDLANVCAKALARAPEDRYPTTLAFRKALSAATPNAWLDRAKEEPLGEWAGRICPPKQSLVELERSLLAGTSSTIPAHVADLPTLAASRDTNAKAAPDTTATRNERRAAATINRGPSKGSRLALLATLVGLGILGLALGRSNTALTKPKPTPSASPKGPSGGAQAVSGATSTAPSPSTVLSSVGLSAVGPSPVGSSTPTPSTASSPPPLRPPTKPRATAPTASPSAASSTAGSALASQPPAQPATTASAGTPAIASATATAPPPARATLGIRSTPYGTIQINGRNYGNSPKRIQLPPGRYTVTITTPNGQSDSRAVQIKAGEHRPVLFSF
jgi:eukaryotic-like serine/threonine-protein kinase